MSTKAIPPRCSLGDIKSAVWERCNPGSIRETLQAAEALRSLPSCRGAAAAELDDTIAVLRRALARHEQKGIKS